MSHQIPIDDVEKLGSTEIIEHDFAEPPLSPSGTPVLVQNSFARIIPVNASAKRAFHDVALRLRNAPDTFVHHRKFVCVDAPVQQPSDNLSVSSVGTIDATSDSDSLLTGYFCLDLNVLPRSIGNGWVIGSGRPKRSNLGIDLRISTDAKRDDVSGRHARLFHHPSSGVLMLAANPGKTVIVNGQELANDNKRVLSVASMGLTFGNLAYRFEFILLNNAVYREQLRRLLRRSEAWSTYQESFDPTPSENHFELRGYQFQTPSFHGTYGVVSACVKTSTGALYAVKRIQRTERLRRLIETELSILRRLDQHPHTCGLVDVFYSNGDAFSMGSRSVNDVYVILEPWAPSSFRALIPPIGDLSYQKSAFHQGAQGIRYLHSRGVTHRDIKPSNLLLASRDPLRVVVADFGHATTERGSKDHHKGTIAYLPPEIMSLKGRTGNGTTVPSSLSQSSRETPGWTTASDVFMYGLVGLELFGEIEHGSRTDIFSLNLPILAAALTRSPDPWKKTLAQMVAFDPASRPDMKQLLLKNIWTDPETPPVDSLRKRRPSGEVVA